MPVRIRHLDRKALEELLVDGVEKVLLLRKVVDRRGRALDGKVEAVQAAQEIGAAEGLRRERVDHAFDLAGDHVAVGEVGVVEDGAKEALGEQVLDQHLFDRLLRQIRVDRLAALVQKNRRKPW